MSIRVVRLGSPRHPDEGPRLGTVRRPPRGVPREEHASRDFYDAWYPVLAPSAETVKLGQTADTAKEWAVFRKRYRKEMSAPPARHALAVLATLSRGSDFSVGCYCEDEDRCHRSVLRELLEEAGADVEPRE